ncbi:hypothetical protein FA95DRAFT_900017 [Auriscalpium vulgare]|uniref:Uncharacterized protein n=1 Tax=Auriscalpium vulgare TaxID=40419 RepID=A0ACB8R8H6_9AGAM|nr:hypothetical protein FA95DRAFT_900017 [Auriscalpium vulgare]
MSSSSTTHRRELVATSVFPFLSYLPFEYLKPAMHRKPQEHTSASSHAEDCRNFWSYTVRSRISQLADDVLRPVPSHIIDDAATAQTALRDAKRELLLQFRTRRLPSPGQSRSSVRCMRRVANPSMPPRSRSASSTTPAVPPPTSLPSSSRPSSSSSPNSTLPRDSVRKTMGHVPP